MITIKTFTNNQLNYERSKYSFAKKLNITPQRLEHYLNGNTETVSKEVAKIIWDKYKVVIYPWDLEVLNEN